MSCPTSGIAVTDGDAVVLLDYDGTVLGEVHSVLVTNGLGSGPGLSTLLVRPGPSFEIGGPESVEAAAGCDTPAGGGGLRVMLCGGAEQLRERVVTVDPLGVEDDLIEAAPGSQEMGHWRWALPSPDGQDGPGPVVRGVRGADGLLRPRERGRAPHRHR